MKDRPSPEKLRSKLAFASMGWLSALFAAAFAGTYRTIIIAAAATFVSAAVFALGKRLSRFALLISTAALAAGVYLYCYETQTVGAQQALAGSRVTVSGTVTALEHTASDRLSVTVKGRTDSGIKTKVSLYCADSGIVCGDKVTAVFDATLPVNTSRFEREDYLRSKSIYLTCDGNAEVAPAGGHNAVIRYVSKLRERTKGRIYAVCGKRAGSFIVSVLCGDRSGLSAEDTSALFRSGLGHIFVVSGTHIVILCAVILFMIKPLIPSKMLRSAVMIALLTAFAAFSGFSVPVVRACIMSGFGFTAVFFRRRSTSSNSLGAAAILMTLSCPYAVTSASFLMSFAASYSFGSLSPELCRDRVKSSSAKAVISYICVYIIMLPFTAYYFSELPLLSVLSNLLLIPICAVCLCLAFIFMLSGGLLTPVIRLAGILSHLLMDLCRLITRSKLSYAGTYHKTSLILCGAAAASALIYLAYRTKHSTKDTAALSGIFAAAICAVSLLSSLKAPESVTILPDRKGCTAVVWTGSDALIFDLGARAGRRYDAVRLCETLHPDETALFLTEKPYTTAEGYRLLSADIVSAYSPDDLPGLTLSPALLEAEDIRIAYSDGRYTVSFDGHTIVLSDTEITADELHFFNEGFSDTSVIVL